MTAPDFTLKDQFGNDFNLYANLDQTIMLVFYPKDHSPVCTKQLCDYNDNLEKFSKVGIKVVAINIDEEISHKKFAKKNSLKYPVLSDSVRKVSELFGAINFAGFNKRKIVIISTEKNVIFEKTVFPAYFPDTNELLKLIESNDIKLIK